MARDLAHIKKLLAMASERVDALEALQATEEQADGERYLTVQEAADYLSVSRSALYTMSASGDVPMHKIGRSNRYLKSELARWMSARKTGAVEVAANEYITRQRYAH